MDSYKKPQPPKKPNVHFTKPSLIKVADRCFKPSVKFNPTDLYGGPLKYQTNSMSFYQKLNIRLNTIEGNLLRRDHNEIERERMRNLRQIKREFIELRHNIQEFNEHYRAKIKRRRDEKVKRREERRRLRELLAEVDGEIDLEALNRELFSQTPKSEPDYNRQMNVKLFQKSRSVIGGCTNFRHWEPEALAELGLKGVEIPQVHADWGKVSRTILDYHKAWAKERHEKQEKRKKDMRRQRTRRRQQKDEEEEGNGGDSGKERSKSALSYLSDLSYFQSCLARPFAYEEFADKKISCRENEEMWVRTLRTTMPSTYKRYTNSGEEVAIVQRQLTERNLDRARSNRRQMKPPTILIGTDVNDKVNRLKFTNKKTLEERAELDRKMEEERIETDRNIRRHKYLNKNITVTDISVQRPSYLRYRYGVE